MRSFFNFLLVPFFFFSLFFLFLSSPTFARHAQVLGVSAQEESPAIPLSEGPGLLLPNSPFYFIDLWRDNLNLLLASFNQEAKARLHMKIAAERIVEVKLMLEGRNVDPAGLDTALTNIAQNMEGAKIVLKTQRTRGHNVEKLASALNQLLDSQQVALRIVAKASDQNVRLKIRAVQKAVEDDEIEIEDELPEDELENEIEEELGEKIEDEVEEASATASRVELLVERLNREASRSAQKALRKREEAIRRAIEEQNKESQRVEEQLKKEEERKIKELREAQKETAEDTRKAAKEARKAAERLQKLQEKVTEIRQIPVEGETGGGGSSGSSGND